MPPKLRSQNSVADSGGSEPESVTLSESENLDIDMSGRAVSCLAPFNEKEETMSNFLLRVKHYIKANKVAEDLKVSVLLSVLGPRLVTTLSDLLAPAEVDDHTFDQLVETLKNHFKPCTLTIVERYRFGCRNQQPNETIAEYVVTLKHMASTCNFGTFLKDALRDKLVSGIRDDNIRQRLLTEELSLEDSLKRALMLEEAIKQKSTFETGQGSGQETVNKVRVQKPKPPPSSSTSKDNFSHQPSQSNKKIVPCYRCGSSSHVQYNCPYKGYRCNGCQSLGHLLKVCKKKTRNVKNVTEESDNCIFHIKTSGDAPYVVTLTVNKVPLDFELDTGSLYTIISKKTFQQYFSSCPLKPSRVKLTALWFSEHLPLLGCIEVKVVHNSAEYNMEMFVLDSGSRVLPSLLGRQWNRALQLLEVPAVVHRVADTPPFDPLVKKLKLGYPKVFDSQPGHIIGFKASIVLRDGAVPVFCKARPVPYALRSAVDAELDKMEIEQVVTRVKHSDWATPLVVVPKPQGAVRICCDFKVTLNRVLQMEHYPLPLSKDIFAKLRGGKLFSILDLKGAYLQLPVREDCKHLLTVNTHKGLFRYNFLPYGLASSPSIFQCVMDQILKDVPGCACYIDDVILKATSKEEMYAQLEKVFRLFSKHNIKVNIEKCKFFMPEVKYLGFVISERGIKPGNDLLKSIEEAPEPTDRTELRSYLGLLNFYNEYIPHASAKLAPLYDLTKTNAEWNWTPECAMIFQQSKKWLCNSSMLTYFDSSLPLRMTTDASGRGVGAVISHIVNGKERPIAFASKKLTTAESFYSQIEREALGIIFGIKKFHTYLFGRHFELVCDNKPLTLIFGEKKAIPPMAAARLQRWSILLSAYNYRLTHKHGKTIGNADFLSRCPVDDAEPVEMPYNAFSSVKHLDNVLLNVDSEAREPLTATDIAEETQKNETLKQVFNFVRHGWPANIEDERLKPYERKRDELTTDSDCILWGSRVIIPELLQGRVTQLLHGGHPGIVKMKMLARTFVWWPKIDDHLEFCVKNCEPCQQSRHATNRAPLHHWPVPSRRWQRVHIDFAQDTTQKGQQRNMLLVVDAYSKWMEVFQMGVTTTEKTIEKLRTLFSAYGLPEEIVSDNGVQFTSFEFAEFVRKNKIRHTLTPPYHAQSNGAVERCVQSTKQSLLKQLFEQHGTSLQHKLDNFLFHYRNTPHATTQKTPAELFLTWVPRTYLTLLKPSLASFVENRQRVVEEKVNVRRQEPEFRTQDLVWVKTRRGETQNWEPGTVISRKSPLTFRVSVGGAKTDQFIHADHLKKRVSQTVPLVDLPPPTSPPSHSVETSLVPAAPPSPARQTDPTPPLPALPSRPVRVRKPPARLNL